MRTRLLTALMALALPTAALAQTSQSYDTDWEAPPDAPAWEEERPQARPPPAPGRAEQSGSQQPGQQQPGQQQQPPQSPAEPPQQQVTIIEAPAEAPAAAAPAPAPAPEIVIQPAPDPVIVAAAPAQTETQTETDERGIVVMGQAGVLTYTGEAARVTRPGSSYGVAVGMDLVRGITAEVGYLGSSYRSEGDGPTVGMTENGAQALIQLGPQQNNFHPFAMFGFQATRINALEREGANPDVQDATHLKLPMGAGLNYTVPSDADAEITVGARAAYNFTLDAGAFPTLNEPAAANQFTGMAVVGGRF